MKKLLLVLAIALSLPLAILAQSAPQMFSYQGVARDNTGNVLANQDIGLIIEIRIGASSGPVAYQEEHQTTTNAFGLFNIQVGNGIPVGSFANIDWASNAHWMLVRLDPDGSAGAAVYEEMGTSQLLSVPYALHANSSAGTLDDAYDSGNPGDGRVIDATDGALLIEGTDGLLVTGTHGSGADIEVSGAGTRMFFNPKKSAFRAGSVVNDVWDDVNVGEYSVGMGHDATASGANGIAIGEYCQSLGPSSVAMGNGAIASGAVSISLGSGGQASGPLSVALGIDNVSSGQASVSMGGNNMSSGDYSFSMGSLSTASEVGATAVGHQATASGNYSVALGYQPSAEGNNSFALGFQSDATAGNSFALGNNATASSSNAFAIGANSEASGIRSIALGNAVKAYGDRSIAAGSAAQSYGVAAIAIGDSAYSSGASSVALGNNARAEGDYASANGLFSIASGDNAFSMGNAASASGTGSFAIGQSTSATGEQSFAAGNNSEARSQGEFVVGQFNSAYTPMSATTWEALDRQFVVGNGTDVVNRTDAMVILKNGNTGISVSNPTDILHVADGDVHFDRNQDGTAVSRSLTLSGKRSGNGNFFASLEFRNQDDLTEYLGSAIRSFNGAGFENGDLRFYVRDGFLAEGLRITHEADIYIPEAGSAIIMKSPDGTCWHLTVSNAGVLEVTEALSCP